MGRKKGSKNKKTLAKMAEIQQALAEGKTPLQTMLEQMRFADTTAENLLAAYLDHLHSPLPVINCESPELLEQSHLALRSYVIDGFAMMKEMHYWRELCLVAASKAAPFCHPTMSAIKVQRVRGDGEVVGNTGIQVQFVDAVEDAAVMDAVAKSRELTGVDG